MPHPIDELDKAGPLHHRKPMPISGDNFTLLILKPDVCMAPFIEAILGRVNEQFTMKMLWHRRIHIGVIDLLYAEHVGKPFYEEHARFMTSGPSMAMLLYCDVSFDSPTACRRLRQMVGSTDPRKAERGTIRQLYGTDLPRNAVHASDSASAVTREAPLFFSVADLFDCGAGCLFK
ncbi:MAG: nucleoside-diphosphate kinase [Giesbergeria sp.]